MAHGRFAKDKGMVVDIINVKAGYSLWNCAPWSDYPDEREILFLGTLQDFYFKTIHDIPLQLNYEDFIRPISMLSVMIRGYPYSQCPISRSDVLCIGKYIDLILETYIKIPKIPTYMVQLFKNIVNNIYNVEINMGEMNCHDEYASQSSFGYLLFKPLFISNGSIQFNKFVKLFKNKLQNIIAYNCRSGREGFKPSIELNDEFMKSTISTIEAINGSIKLQDTFKQIIIINPTNDIDIFISQ